MDKYQNIEPTKLLKTDSGEFKDTSEELEERVKHIDVWDWKYYGGLLHGSNIPDNSKIHKISKVAMFDMDGTQITAKSGVDNGRPENEFDWIWYDKVNVPSKLKRFFKDGYRICIITNQKGISLGKLKDSDIKKKIEMFIEEISLPVQVFVASADDAFRKPQPGIFHFLKEHCMKPHGIEPDMKASFFVGDAAGRPKTMDRVKDFSDFDIKFAKNAGLTFYCPEEFFRNECQRDLILNFDKAEKNPFYHQNEKSQKNEQPLMYDANYPTDTENIIPSFESKTNIMVILIGSPGSGKSTFCKNYLPGFVRVNNDNFDGNSKKALQLAKNTLKDTKENIVIDNTNKDMKTRRDYIEYALKSGYEVYAFDFKMEKVNAIFWDNCRLNNQQRKPISKRVGAIPVHTFYKHYEKPDLAEGYVAIKNINPLVKCDTEYEKKFYTYFTEIKYR